MKSNCKNCNKEIISKYAKIFCNSSCSATYNNAKRVRTVESKRKTSLSMGGSGKARSEHRCRICNIITSPGFDLCVQHSHEVNPRDYSYLEKVRLRHLEYEKLVELELRRIFGNLKVEIIDGIAFDFCNDKYIIEFTFCDKGINNLTNRFKKLTDNKRKRVAYLPYKYFGRIRRERLEDLNVEVFDSSEYIRYHPYSL